MKTIVKNQKGVALLYVMGILALLMVMALAFMNSSIFDMRVAANTNSGAVSEQLAQAAIENVVWALKNDPNVFGNDQYFYSWMPDDHYDTDITSKENHISRDGLEALDTYDFIGGTKIYTFDYNDKKNKTIVDRVRWTLFRSASEKVGSYQIKPVIGRAAFWVIQLGQGQINPKDIVADEVDELASPRPEKRRGIHLSEINFRDIDSIFTSSNAKFVNYQNTGDGAMPPTGWSSKDEFITKMADKLSLSGKKLENATELVDRLFVFDNPEEKERFVIEHPDLTDKINLHRFYLPGFIDRNNNGIADNDELTDSKYNRWEISDTDYINKYLLLSPDTGGKPTLDIVDKGTWLDINDSGNDAHTEGDPGRTGEIPTDNEKMGSYGVGLPWLALFGYDRNGVFNNDDTILKGTFETVLDRRRQIAANLKDYCDSDDIPTSDISPASWSLTGDTNIPKYTGNEKTPYLNEFQLRSSFAYSVTKSNDNKKLTASATTDLNLYGEIVNIYEGLGTPGADTKIILSGSLVDSEITIKFDNDYDPDTKPLTFSNNNLEMVGWTSGDNGYFHAQSGLTGEVVFEHFAEIAGEKTKLPDNTEFEININFHLDKVMLEFNGKRVDYAKIDKNLRVKRVIKVEGETTEKIKSYIFTTQTEDPRQNLNSGDWIIPKDYIEVDEEGNETGMSGLEFTDELNNIGKCNPCSDPSNPNKADDGADLEIVTNVAFFSDIDDIKRLSTAFIRNAPMLSPWELGFIHRGVKWQTLNIHTYDDEKSTTAIQFGTGSSAKYYPQGGGRYDFGDANILDQIKMTPGVNSPRKINIIAAEKEIWDSLLKIDTLMNGEKDGVYKTDYVKYNSSSRQDIDKILGEASFSYISNTYNHIKSNVAAITTRAAIAKSVDLRNAGKTKAAQDEMIGKIINLTDVYTGIQSFEMIVVAQSIKDIGSTVKGSPLEIEKHYYVNGKLSDDTVKIKSFIGEINYVIKDGQTIIADEILSQTKYRVRGYLDANGEVQLSNVRIVE